MKVDERQWVFHSVLAVLLAIDYPVLIIFIDIKALKTKCNQLYIRNQSVPRCKHVPPRLFKDQTQSALYKESVRTAL